jgi:lipopolysaccharide transport system ATP-binding protein
MAAAIVVEKLSKQYRVGTVGTGTLHEDVARWWATLTGRPDPAEKIGTASAERRLVGRTFRALDGISFSVQEGEILGVIGRNGAGKSTLLKILSQVTAPTAGCIRLRGRLASLLEVGTGFHPDLTGRENIFLNGAILGMTKSEIRRRFDEIVAFSECDDFIDTPVKRYSSGMYVRLAFSVAAHLESEILVIDEVLAVGDSQFQRKCLGKMSEVAGSGRTVLFVSHSMAAIQNLCSSCLFLEGGKLARLGPTKEITDHYLSSVLPHAINSVPLAARTDRSGSGVVKLTEFHVDNGSGVRLGELASGNDAHFVFRYEVSSVAVLPLSRVDVGISLHTEDDRTLFVLYSSYLGKTLTIDSPSGEFRCLIPRLPLSAGRYRVHARVCVGHDEADWPRDGVGFVDVIAADFYRSGNAGTTGGTYFLVDGNWAVQ